MLAGVLNPGGYLITLHSVGPWLVGLLIGALGTTLLIRERGSKVSLALWLFTTSLAVWLLCVGVLYSTLHESLALWWAKATLLGVVFIPTTLLAFTLTVVQRLDQFRAVVWGSVAASGFFGITVLATDHFIAGLYRYQWGYYPRYGPLGLPFLLFFSCLLLGSLQLLRVELARLPPGIPRQRVKAILVAFAVGYLGAVDYLPTYGVPVYPLGYVPILGLTVLMSRAIWRYRLLEITPALAAEQIIDTVADGVLVLDHQGIVRVANQAAVHLFGYSKEALVGKPLGTMLGDRFGQEHINALAATGLVQQYETVYHTEEGKTLTLDVTGSVARDRAGHPVAFVFIARDITGRRQLEEQLRQAQKLEALGQLAGEIAHSFDTIVTLISRHSGRLLSRLEVRSPIRGDVEDIKNAADRAAELSNQLLACGSTQPLHPTQLDLNALVADLREVLQWTLGKDIGLTTVLDPALGRVKADRGQIERVVIKLVANAGQAMGPGGTLAIETANVQVTAFPPHPPGLASPGKYAMLAVSVSGWVMDEGTRTHLFEPSLMKTREGKVTGLDLAMVYGTVKQSGGHIAVESELERGTTFRIYLPLEPQTEELAELR
jgi:PAS domain S-box-containing protein